MGVDFYNCTSCNEIFNDCGEYKHCCLCDEMFCGYCDGLEKIPWKCDGDCHEGYKENDDDEKEEEGGGKRVKRCSCHPDLKNLYKQRGCDYHDRKESHWVCQECLTIADPYAVSDVMLMEYLLNHHGFETIEAARKAYRCELKAKKSEDDEEEEDEEDENEEDEEDKDEEEDEDE